LNILIAFIVAAVISFVGSVLLGLVNMAVIETAITKSPKSALWLAFGGVLPEIPYTLIPLMATGLMVDLEPYKNYIGIAVGIIFMGMGALYLRQKKKKEESEFEDHHEIGAWPHFLRGFSLAISNMQLLFFWTTVILALDSFTPIEGIFSESEGGPAIAAKFAFSLGAAAGAFLILYIYTRLASRYKKKLRRLIGEKLTIVVGGFFLLLGFITVLKNVL
jgi:threonine/homoserine/homoserine lactone efflux protein